MSQSQRIGTAGCGLSRSHKLNLIIAGVSWTLGSIVLAFYIREWAMHGLPGIENTITTAFAVIGTALGGLLALSGDGDVAFFTGIDEGQRAVLHRTSAGAFSVTFWGMFALWMAYQIQPSWRADAWLHLGGLLLLSMIFYSGGYLWRRWR
ncbi:MAG TPA: hypothetical protein VH349_09660 [Ktedonobacterales bacterium]|jgi:hypothetical protein